MLSCPHNAKLFSVYPVVRLKMALRKFVQSHYGAKEPPITGLLLVLIVRCVSNTFARTGLLELRPLRQNRLDHIPTNVG
jgi:hypothetical protein